MGSAVGWKASLASWVLTKFREVNASKKDIRDNKADKNENSHKSSSSVAGLHGL